MRNTVRNKKSRKFTHKMQAKLLLVFCVVLIAMLGLIVRLVYLNHVDGERYAKRVLSQQTYTSTVIPYQRGSILDRKGTVLAASEKVYNIILDIKLMLGEDEYLNPTVKALTETFEGVKKDTIMDLVEKKPDSQYIILKKGISYEEVSAFKKKEEKDKNIYGVWFEEDYVRKYPYKTLGSDVIGFTSSGNVGNWGIEQYYNDQLNGINGIEYGYIDSGLKLEQTTKPAVNGNTIISTIDANVQGIIQEHIKKYNTENGSKNIGVIIMDPNNGEILAMASNAEYDLNNPMDLTPFYTKAEIDKMSEKDRLDALNAIWRNYTISDTYEPGSTFKPFTVSAGLEENIIHANDTYVCDGGQKIGGYYIRCTHVHGTVTLAQALMLSCNDALMQIGAKEGKKLFYDYQNFFGIGHKTGIDLPGEASGILVPESGLGPTELATSSFGQTFTVSMIQMASGFSSLVNGGYYYQPHIMKQIINPAGATLQNFDKVLVKESVSAETSKFIRNAMYLTVEEGTATGAKVPGYKVGGKTGTAQKLPRADRRHLVSFIGAVPADKPQMVIYVVIDDPQNVEPSAQSSSIATKFAGEILKDILPFLGIYSSDPSVSSDLDAVSDLLPSNVDSKSANNNTQETDTSEPQNTLDDPGNKGKNKEDNTTDDVNSEDDSSDTSNTIDDPDGNTVDNLDFLPESMDDLPQSDTQSDNSD
ncbi:penicillin-binding protein 2 [Anaerocolumna sp. AGMB13025]|uniref:peptidoglycan D,D-transpeptidase FtsI family protein n=1 Tax=Anaerocolumna sp. AGMB13025 TaxID=3039116 RepID=UPI00241DFB65|nr:penicillin-binding protein 2 [Anaerocolumna sp. AGMB13025]WFR55004.1 penicillin-binding protein 2 [Anaerocolumna sp. AGMB13025]